MVCQAIRRLVCPHPRGVFEEPQTHKTMTPSQQLPWRFREASFRTYEALIHFIVNEYPSVVTVTPEGFNLPPSLETCTARCRDAMTSLLNNGWDTKVDVQKLREIHHDLVVTQKDGLLVLGPTKDVRAYKGESRAPKTSPLVSPSDIQLTITTHVACGLLMELAVKRLLNQSIFLVETLYLNEAMVASLTGSYDVALVRQENGWLLLN